MKNFIKLFVLILAAALLFMSCIEKGGTIDVTNQAELLEGGGNLVIIVKGYDFTTAVSDLANGKGTLIAKGAKKSFNKDEDGVYTVVAAYPSPVFTQVVTLLAGNTVSVVIK